VTSARTAKTTTVTATATNSTRALRLLLATATARVAAAGSAWAHGDPASHYLETDSFYPSFASQPSQQVQLRLLGLLNAAERRRYPIKVALLTGPEDLVDDTAMLGMPQRYAEFVARAIDRTLRGPIVIVTPHGVGTAGKQLRDGGLHRITRDDARSLLRGIALPPDPQSDDIARTAMVAVRQLAREGGRALPARVPPAKLFTGDGTAPRPVARAAAGGGGGAGMLLPAVPVALLALAVVVARLRRTANA
jgi:hypothetical protein